MLAECYGRVGADEQRLDALRQAAEGDRGSGIRPHRAGAGPGPARASSTRRSRSCCRWRTASPSWRLDLVRLLIQKTSPPARDQRNWQEVERHLREAEKALPEAVEPLTLLRLDMLAAQDRLEDARSLLSSAQAKDPRNLQYRLALARLTQRQGKGPAALQILDQAEKDLGPSLDIQLARLDYWGLRGGRRGQGRGGEAGGDPRSKSPPPTGPRSSIGSPWPRSGSASRPWRGNTGASWRPSSRITSVSGSGCSTWPSRPATRTPPPISWTRSARSKATREPPGGSRRRLS